MPPARCRALAQSHNPGKLKAPTRCPRRRTGKRRKGCGLSHHQAKSLLGIYLQYCCDTRCCLWIIDANVWSTGDGIKRCCSCNQFRPFVRKKGGLRSYLSCAWQIQFTRFLKTIGVIHHSGLCRKTLSVQFLKEMTHLLYCLPVVANQSVSRFLRWRWKGYAS